MLMINNEVVAQVLHMRECIAVQEAAFAGLLKGESIFRPRIDTYVPCDREDGYYRFGTVEGASGGYYAVRLKSDIVHWPRGSDGGTTESKYCMQPGTYCGLVFLFSTGNGEPLALLNDGHLQHMRVGGGAGIGTKYLSREDSHTVGMLGSGGMARTFLEAFKCVRDIRLCKVYSPNPNNREAYAEEMSKKLGIGAETLQRWKFAVEQGGSTVEHAIVEELKRCRSFTFSVAFISPGAIAQLKQHLLDFRGSGRIITSDFLGFNEPRAFAELLNLQDLLGIEVRRHTAQGFHPKGYVFEKHLSVTAMIGSSNLGRALKKTTNAGHIGINHVFNGRLVRTVTETEFKQ